MIGAPILPLPVLAPMAGISAAYVGLFLACEGARRAWRIEAEVTRKLAHVAGGGIALTLPLLFDSAAPVVILAVGFAALLVVSRRLGQLGSIHDVERRTTGAYLYPVGVAAAFALAGHDALRYPGAILALSLGDAAAGLVGTRYGRRWWPVWGARRSLEGSLAAFGVVATTTVLVSLGSGTASVALTALAVGAAVALAEAASPAGTDNLAIPLVALAATGGEASAAIAVALAALALGVAAPAIGREHQAASRSAAR